ncbi:alpha-galactosidase [uncultured Draconibacterium sp.]|uniref:alpha-galactosidase n=1 Tax=uncultured Draconibacterium sp. TaxID=1573823 RepID=UPI003217DAEA
MISDKLGRRNFLKYCTATAIGSGLMINPLSVFSNENEKLKQKKEKFKLSKPRWIIYDNGSYDLISKEIILKNCRPSIDGQGVMPKNVFLGDSPKGKRIVYELPGGFLMLDLKTNKDNISIGAEFSGFSRAPRWFCPISQAEVLGVNHYFKQGFGTDGNSGVFPIQNEKNKKLPQSWSSDSFMAFGFLGNEETIAIGNTVQNDFLQRFTIYNRPHSTGINNKINENQVFLESGMLLDEIDIENEYIKLPELHFYTGNRPLETFQELAWQTSRQSGARQGSPTSYHWISPQTTNHADCCENLKTQIANAKEKSLLLHTFCIKNYCIEGDWLEPFKDWTGGLDNAARTIYKDGFRAGISLSPFRVSENSKIYKTHIDWLIKDNYNQEIVEDTVNGEKFYALDASHPGVEKYISKVFRALRKMGFIFYETPHLSYAFKDSNEVNRKVVAKSSVQIFRDICSLIRTEIGPGSLWMAGETPYSPLLGFADIVKVNSQPEGNWTREKLNNFMREAWYTHYFNNIYWQNSPGEITLSEENGLNKAEIESFALWTGFLGGAVGTSDNFTELNDNQLNVFRFLEPSKQQQNAYLPFWPNYDSVKVAIRTYKNPTAWAVLLFNDKSESVQQNFEIFDLIEKDEIFVYSWDEHKMTFGNLEQLRVSLEPFQTKLFYLTEKDEAPNQDLTLGGKMPKEK